MKSGSVDRNDDHERQEEIEHARREYFQTNPETKPYDDLIKFHVNGKTVSVDDSELPEHIASIVRKRDGRNTL